MAQCYHIARYYAALAIAAEKQRQTEYADRLMAISSRYLYASNGQKGLPVL